MVSELQSIESERPAVRLTSTNFALWEFQFRVFVEGKGLLSILDGTQAKPEGAAATPQAVAAWTQNDARVRSWLLGSVDSSTCLSLRLYPTANRMWRHLSVMYSTVNAARQFEIQIALSRLEQGERTVSEYFNAAQELWIEQDLLHAALRPQAVLSEDAIAERMQTRLLNFLMKLRPEFESVRATLLNRDILQFDGVLGKLMREEIRLRTQAAIDLRPGEGESIVAAAAAQGVVGANRDNSAYGVSRPQFQQRVPVSDLECHHCREKGHVQKHCRRRNFCVYCKRMGHIILDCRTRERNAAREGGPPPRGNSGNYQSRQGYGERIDRPAYGVYHTDDGGSWRSGPSRDAWRPGGRSSGTLGEASSSKGNQPGNAIGDVGAAGGVTMAAVEQIVNSTINAAFATLNGTGKIPSPWLIDSACYNHMTHESHTLKNVSPVNNMELMVANGNKLQVNGMVDVEMKGMTLRNTLHVPDLVPNLVSVGQLTEQGYTVSFAPTGCLVQDSKTGRLIGRGSKQGRLFHLEELHGKSVSPVIRSTLNRSVRSPESSSSCSAISSTSNKSWELWHARLGHPHSQRLSLMFNKSLLGKNSARMPDFHSCTSCVEAKTASISYPSSTTVIQEPFHVIHTDLWGPAPTVSRHGFCYFALFIDHATRYTWIYLLRLKSDLQDVAIEFLNMVQTQFGKPVKIIRSDPGGEFSSFPLREAYRSRGILSQKSCPGISQQNGLVERKNCHVVELTRALLLASYVPSRFWPEAVVTAVRLINYQITPVLGNVSPFFKLFARHPDYSRLRVFGCLCFVLLPKRERTKLTSRTAKCAFLGYSDVHKGYMCFDPVAQRIRVASTVVFFEHMRFFAPQPTSELVFPLSSTIPMFHEDDAPAEDLFPSFPPDDTDSPSSSQATSSMATPGTSSSSPVSASSGIVASSPVQQPRRSLCSTKGVPPLRFDDYMALGFDTLVVPTRYKDARGDPRWEEAMGSEFDALHANHTWDVVDHPAPDTPTVGSRWVYTIKMNPDGTIERFRARVVALGYTQEHGVDYNETFAPVARMSTVRTLLAVASIKHWTLSQLDVKNAFLHGDLDEVIYMEKPPGYNVGGPGQVRRLRRSLYGLKQAPRAWFEKFHGTLVGLGYCQSLNDPSLFIKTTSRGIVILLLYVDDMIIAGSDLEGIRQLKDGLHVAFRIKDLGQLSYFLGLEVSRSASGIFLCQRKYISDLLGDYNMGDCVPVHTPIELNLKLRKESGDKVKDSSQYRSIVGSLIYLSATRPDISYAVQLVSQFMADPRTDHLAAVYRILRYLRGTMELGLLFPSSGTATLRAYSDSDYAGCVDTRRSTTGWCVQFGNSFISWRCKKQDKVSKSSTEAEYRAMSDVTSELTWLRRLLRDMGVETAGPMDLFVDNTSAIRIAENPVLHDRTKHIEVHVHYVRDEVRDGTIALHYIRTEDQVVDMLTKSFSTSRHKFLTDKLMLVPRHQFGGGC
ncbi:unnamed protein product [Linum trigynum]|uniref:Integrase catalytic domain-containing protein n=1 Tax=Linum trigynum TaxID=586398 RepID=A0AAV2GTZ1_9ROSI